MAKRIRIFYFAGPGDVIGTYRHWKRGRDDPGEVSITYSGQFYDACREADAEAMVVSSHPRAEVLREGRFTLEHRPAGPAGGKVTFHLRQVAYLARLMASAAAFGAEVFLIGSGAHYFALAPLRMMGVRVVPSMHCAPWPAGMRPGGRGQRAIQWLNGWFWRRVAGGTIAVSPECERQVRELAGSEPPRGGVRQVRAQYRRGYFEALRPPPPHGERPFRVMYAGRVERSKGVFELLEAARRLEGRRPGAFAFELCGDGVDRARLEEMARQQGLERSFVLRGKLDQGGMAEAFGRAHVVVVPTSGATPFAEGLNKVAVEAALAGRPVVTSRLSNAVDVLRGAVAEVPPDDVEAYARALEELADDAELYEAKRRACAEVTGQFYDRAQGFGEAVRELLRGARWS